MYLVTAQCNTDRTYVLLESRPSLRGTLALSFNLEDRAICYICVGGGTLEEGALKGECHMVEYLALTDR